MPRKPRDPAAAMIICSICKIEKPTDEFPPTGLRCRLCLNAAALEQHHKHRAIKLVGMKNRRKRIRDQREAGVVPDVDLTELTVCTACGETKPLGEFRKSRNSLTGLMQPCKQCSSKQTSAYQQRVKAQRKAGALPKVDISQPWGCTQCGETKPMHEFMRQQHTKSGFAQPCRDCSAKRAKAYAKEHPEKAQEWRNKNPDKVIKAAQKWQRENPDKVRGYWAARRARKRNAHVEKVEFAVLYERDHGTCQRCHKRITKQQASIDHIVPLGLGGQHSYKNTQLMCRSCNFKKQKTGKGDQMRLF